MSVELPYESAPYRVTLFFGPEPVEGRADTLHCVFNVKKRSWKAGVQVSVELSANQSAALLTQLSLSERLAEAFATVPYDERPSYEARAADLFTQAVCWCKLDLRLQTGLTQENQTIPATELVSELDRAVLARKAYVLSFILAELDLVPNSPSPSSS